MHSRAASLKGGFSRTVQVAGKAGTASAIGVCYNQNMRTRPAALVLLGALAIAPLGAQGRFTKQDADRFQTKLVRIVQQGKAAVGRTGTTRSTPVSDVEVNSYLRFHAADQIPVGILEPTLNALGEGRVSGRAVVDLDAVRKQKQRGWLDPMSYLTGRLPVSAAGRLTTKDGRGQFQLETAEISGVTIPKAVLQELVSYYSRTPENPAGLDMDAPFELPSRIREIRVGSGTSTVVQ
jgi:hypothetical protein